MESGLIAFTKGGEWRQAMLDSPLEVLPGDTCELDGTTLWLKRNNHYPDSRNIGESQPLELGSFQFPATIERVIFFARRTMSTQVTLVDSHIEEGSGQMVINWGDGLGEPFQDFEEFRTSVDAWAANVENAKMLLKLALRHRSDDGSDITACNGAVCVVDGQSSAIVTLSGVPAP